MKRYKELKYEDRIYTETYKIDEILIKNKFNWFLDCEVENARIEILKGHLIFNSGVFFNGSWIYGVFRDGQWKSGSWEGGVWYNGTWYNGIFKDGLIFNGRFLKGEITGGEIRGGEFYDIKIKESVVRKDKVEPEAPVEIQKIEPVKITENLKHIRLYEQFDEDDPWGEDIQKKEDENVEGYVIVIQSRSLLTKDDIRRLSKTALVYSSKDHALRVYDRIPWDYEDRAVVAILKNGKFKVIKHEFRNKKTDEGEF